MHKRALTLIMGLVLALLAVPSAASAEVAYRTAPDGTRIPVSKLVKQTGVAENRAKLLSLQYFYNTGYQYANAAGPTTPCTGNVGADGISADHRVSNPFLDTAAGDFHTLQQIWAQSCNGQQAIELGWAKKPSVYGDSLIHLFAGYRKNGTFMGWGTGFTQVVGATYTQGQALTADVGTGKKFAIQQFSGAWWVGYNNVWFGYFDNTLYTAAPSVTFTKTGLGQTGGEVAANSSAPCTDMGNGLKGKVGGAVNTSASYSYNWGWITPPAGVTNNIALQPSANTTYYDQTFNGASTRSFHLGGPGAC